MSFNVENSEITTSSSVDVEAMHRYIEENIYVDLSQEKHARAEREWSHYPKESEERKILELMRKKMARKKADERAYREYLELQKYKKKPETDSHPVFYFMDIMPSKMSFHDYINESKSKSTFNEVFEKFREEKKPVNIVTFVKRLI